MTLYPDNPSQTRRLNSVVVHLLSRGVNQMGASLNGSHDQTYITSAEFDELLPALQADSTDQYNPEASRIVTMRLLVRAGVNYGKYYPDVE